MLADSSSADVLIVDGPSTALRHDVAVSRPETQIVLRVTAALPGDEVYGHLAATCSEDLLNALVGIFTDMLTLGRLLGRPVVYTPLPICSVYAGVHGAIAVGAALADRERSGKGREIVASRLAGGLSAIGALTLTSSGIPPHLAPARLPGIAGGRHRGAVPGHRPGSRSKPREAAVAGAAIFAARVTVQVRRRPPDPANGVSEPPSHRAPAEGARTFGTPRWPRAW